MAVRRTLLASIVLIFSINLRLGVARADPASNASAVTQSDLRKCRAGSPDTVAPWARCTYGRLYCGQYVGGGTVVFGRRASLIGEPPGPLEGTFGMDYAPPWSRVNLLWSHGRKYQGGEGQYQPNRINNPFPNFFRR